MKRTFLVTALLTVMMSATMAQKTFDVNVINKSKTDRKAVPVVLTSKIRHGR